MGNISGASLSSIENRLSGVSTYHPMEAETFSDWATEAGDVVTVRRGNESYQSPVYSSKLVWRGTPQVTLSSTGNKERESLQKVSGKKYKKGGNALRNSNNLQRQLTQAYNGLRSFFEITESRLRAEFKGDYDGLSSYFEVTRSRMAADFEGKYDGLTGFFEVTRSHLVAEFSGKYDGLVGHFEVTRSIMQADFSGKYDGLVGHFEVTRSIMQADFSGKYDGLVGHFEVTRSQMAADFSNKYAGLSSHFELTASNFNVAINNAYTGLSSKIESTESSLESSVSSATTRAALLLKINGDGKSQAYIEADRIKIGNSGQSVITLNDKLSVSSTGNLTVSGNATMNNLSLTSGSYITFNGSSGQYWTLGPASIVNLVKGIKIEPSGNTYTLYKKSFSGSDDADKDWVSVGTFSRAVSSWTDTWSGNAVLSVKANPQNQTHTIGFGSSYGSNDLDLEVVGNGAVTKDTMVSMAVSVPIAVQQLNSGQTAPTQRYTKNITFSISNLLESLTPTTAGNKTPSANYVGLSNVNIQLAAGASQIVWDSTNKYFYNYAYAYLGGSNTAAAESSKRSSSTLSLSTGSWGGTNSASRTIAVQFGASNILTDTITCSVTAAASAITWDSSNHYFYNYGYAYLNGSSQAADESAKRTSSTISLDTSASWSSGNKSVKVKHGGNEILSALVSVPDVDATYWDNVSGHNWRTRLTIGGVYRYSSNKELYTAAELTAARNAGWKDYYDDLIANGNTYWDYDNGKVYIPKGNKTGTVCYVDVTLNGWTLGGGGGGGSSADWATYWMQGWHYYYDLFVGNISNYWDSTNGILYAPSREDSTQNVQALNIGSSAAYNSGFNADHQMFITGPGSNDPIHEVTLNPGAEINYYPTFIKKDGNYQYGSLIKVKVSSSGSSSHSITIDNADGPYSSINVMKEATGVSTLTQILTNKIDSNGYYAFRVKCGSATKWYYIKATT